MYHKNMMFRHILNILDMCGRIVVCRWGPMTFLTKPKKSDQKSTKKIVPSGFHDNSLSRFLFFMKICLIDSANRGDIGYDF